MQRSAFLLAPADDTQSLPGCMQPTQAGEQTERENTLKGSWGGWVRPLSVSFQFRASGKETDVATPLGLEKYGKVDFTQGKLTKRHPKNSQK